ncbi:MAG: enoyl-CoA hydratase-related protein [Dehalococcoidia bacterium]
MDERIAEVALEDGLESIVARLDAALERTAARVAVIDATRASEPSGPLSPAELRQLTLFELPVVFAFEGDLVSAPVDVALAADIRVCSKNASLKGPLAGNARIRALCDEASALDLFIGRRAIPAAELLDAGLVSSVSEDGSALEEARRIAGVIASRGPIATRLAKEAIWRGLPQPIDQALRFETDLTLLLQTTKDRAEGVRAFLEKRTPKFTGE